MPTSYCFFFIVSRLFPFVTTQSSNWYGKLSLFFVYSTANFEVAQGGFPSRFLPRIFPAAPNQHRLFCDLRQEPGNTGPHLLLVICFYIHSKTACRGFKSFCPCQKPAETLRFCRLSFYVLYACGVHAGSDSGFSHPFASARTCFHPLQHPKRTRFCLFSAFPGAFLCFLPFWTCKILGPVFVHCADMPHRLKPSVIPCRREVSFLT